MAVVRDMKVRLTKEKPTTGQRRGQLRLETGRIGLLDTIMVRQLPGPNTS